MSNMKELSLHENIDSNSYFGQLKGFKIIRGDDGFDSRRPLVYMAFKFENFGEDNFYFTKDKHLISLILEKATPDFRNQVLDRIIDYDNIWRSSFIEESHFKIWREDGIWFVHSYPQFPQSAENNNEKMKGFIND